MNEFAPATPTGLRTSRHDLEFAGVLGLAALALLVVGLLPGSPVGMRLPLATDPALRIEGLRDLRALELLESGLLWVLALVVALRGDWLRRQDGLAILDRRPMLVLAVLGLLHVGSMFLWFPAREIFGTAPATSCDNAYHYYQVYAAHQFMETGGHLWGYDPYFMAGYPAGVIFDLDMKGAEIYCHLLSWMGLPLAFKSYIVLTFVLFPFVLYAAGRFFGLGNGETLVAVLVGLLFWHWGRPLLGHFRWAGMHSYVLASYLSLLALALFARFLDETVRGKAETRTRRPELPNETSGPPEGSSEASRSQIWLHGAGLVVLVAIACQVHPLSILLLAPGFATLYLAACRALPRRIHLGIWIGLALVVAANLDWMLPFLRFRHYKTASDYWFQLRGFKDIAFYFSRETSLLFTAITVLGVAGLVRMRRDRPRVALGFGVSVLCLFLAAFYGARLRPLANTEPGRYLLPFAFFLILPATAALVPLLRRLQRAIGPQLVAVGLALAASLTPALSLADNLFFDVHRMRADVDARFVELLTFLGRATTPDARILFETPGGYYNSSDLFYGGHLQAFVPIDTGREVIGGPYPVNFLVHAAVDFKNGQLLDRPIRDWPDSEFTRFASTYNVGWAVCWSAGSRAYFDARPAIARPLGDFDRFRVYEIANPHSFVLRGGGRTHAGYNRIEVTGATGDDIVLKYHWVESLRTEPPVPIEPEPVPGDPVGFIRLRPQGHSRIVIRNGY